MNYESVIISVYWFEDIKTKVSYKDPLLLPEGRVELDVDIARFNRVSKELGYIVE